MAFLNNVIHATHPDYIETIYYWFDMFVLEMAQAINQNNEHCYLMGVQIAHNSRAKPENKIPRDINQVISWLKSKEDRDYYVFYDENYCDQAEFIKIITDYVKKRKKKDVIVEVSTCFFLTAMLNTNNLDKPIPNAKVLWIHYSGPKDWLS